MKNHKKRLGFSDLEFKRDKWLLPSADDLPDYRFYFDYLPNNWIKNEVKNYVLDSFETGNVELSTLYRYNYSLRHFFDALKSNGIEIETFADITRSTIEIFMWYLSLAVESASTRVGAVAALKHLFNYGMVLERDGYPKMELFDRTDFRALKTEDTLKTKIIPDPVIEQVKDALQVLMLSEDEYDVLLGCLVTIVMHTGARLSEVLMLEEDSMQNDLFGKSLLEIKSNKNKTDRYIAIRKEVVEAFEKLLSVTASYRVSLGTRKLFVYKQKRNQRLAFLTQDMARSWLTTMCGHYGIEWRLTFHMFRHTLATTMLANGMTLFEIMNYLGHESMHSTRLYAKVSNSTLRQEYKKLGFIGMISKTPEEATGQQQPFDRQTRLMAQLPDGVCARPIKEKVGKCKIPNACLFCPKFITTPEFIDIHRDHLRRIREDKEAYKLENFVGTDYLIQETESALEEIITRLEGMVNEI